MRCSDQIPTAVPPLRRRPGRRAPGSAAMCCCRPPCGALAPVAGRVARPGIRGKDAVSAMPPDRVPVPRKRRHGCRHPRATLRHPRRMTTPTPPIPPPAARLACAAPAAPAAARTWHVSRRQRHHGNGSAERQFRTIRRDRPRVVGLAWDVVELDARPGQGATTVRCAAAGAADLRRRRGPHHCDLDTPDSVTVQIDSPAACCPTSRSAVPLLRRDAADQLYQGGPDAMPVPRTRCWRKRPRHRPRRDQDHPRSRRVPSVAPDPRHRPSRPEQR